MGLLRVRARAIAGVAIVALLAPVAASPAIAAPADARSQVVTGVRFDATAIANHTDPSAQQATGRHGLGPVAHPRPGAVEQGGRSLPTRPVGQAAASPSRATEANVVAPAAGLFAHHNPNEDVTSGAADATGAIIGTTELIGTIDRLYADSTVSFANHVGNWDNGPFFALPGTDWFWGSSVGASIYRGRFVAVLPSFDGPSASCAHGWLNVAVSSSGDPRQAWTRYRISIGDAWTDAISLGISDDKVVLATNQWDLDIGQPDCLGAPYEGARVRVLDWADLLDGGTLTVRDVTPAGPTSYFNWAPATNVPGTAATTAGATIQLGGDKYVGGTWGHVVYAAITGSAKAATAVMVRNEDLTTLGSVAQLVGPPDTIAAFTSGNGFQDERIVATTWRSGRMWLTTTTSCKLEADTDFRACARYILLNTATTPATVLDDTLVVDLGRDTFLPLAGFSRDGYAYFTMAATSALAQEPIDEYGTSRAPGQLLSGGAAEERIWPGDQAFTFDTYWGSRGSIITEPNDARGVWAEYPAAFDHWAFSSMNTHLKGDQSGAPGGTFTLGNGSGWTGGYYTWATLYPSTTSPIRIVRWSAAPDVEATAGGDRLLTARESTSISRIYNINFEDPAIGGLPTPASMTLYVQWQTADGVWSTPLAQSLQLDTVPPTVTARIGFGTGLVTTSVPVKLSWVASDAASGLSSFQLDYYRISPSPADVFVGLAGTATSYTRSLTLGGHYQVGMQATDRAGGNASIPTFDLTFASVQSSSAITFYKTWYSASSSSFLGGSTRYATAAGASVTYKFTGRSIAFVSTKGPGRGKFEVWLDGVKRTTVDLYASSNKYRQIVYVGTWDVSGAHTIRIKVLGTYGRPRVDFDSFLRA